MTKRDPLPDRAHQPGQTHAENQLGRALDVVDGVAIAPLGARHRTGAPE